MNLHKWLVGLLVMGLLVCLSTAQDAVDDAEDDSDVEEDDGAAEEVTPGVPREKVKLTLHIIIKVISLDKPS